MKVNEINNINFKSRNTKIRYADNLVRHLNNEFPRISLSKLQGLKYYKQYKKVGKNIDKKLHEMRIDKYFNFLISDKFEDKIETIIEPIKNLKLGNCSESANLAMLALRANGIKNCRQVSLTSNTGEDYDHSVVIVKDKKPYIVDAWLGFADYLPNAFKRYQKEYRMYFDFDKFNTEKIHINAIDIPYTAHFVNRDFSEEEVEYLKIKYPELLLKK